MKLRYETWDEQRKVRLMVNRGIHLTDLLDREVNGRREIRCPFHPDTRPSAKLYTDDPDGIQKIWCHVCMKQYTSWDYIQKVLKQDPVSFLRRERPEFAELASRIAWVEPERNEPDPPFDIDALFAEHLPHDVGAFLRGVHRNPADFDFRFYAKRVKALWEVATGETSVHRIKPQPTEEYTAFKSVAAEFAPAVVVTRHPPHYKALPVGLGWLCAYFNANPRFWLIPCAVPGEFAGFVLRSFGTPKDPKRKFLTYAPKEVRVWYGWEAFEDYRVGEPIIVTEGIKDALALRQYYPYVVACMGAAGVTRTSARILSKLTRKVVLAFDGDIAGAKGASKAAKVLAGEAVEAVAACAPPALKDYGALWLRPEADRIAAWRRVAAVGGIGGF